MKKEIRHFAGEIRAGEETEDTFEVKVRFAVTNTWTRIFDFRERIAAGAFEESIPRSDVFLKVNHEGAPLARSNNGKGTLDLRETDKGLEGSAILDLDNPRARELRSQVTRGDISGASFAFTSGPSDQDWDGDDRTIRKLTLHDVSLVEVGAYPTAGLLDYRSDDGAIARESFTLTHDESERASTELARARSLRR